MEDPCSDEPCIEERDSSSVTVEWKELSGIAHSGSFRLNIAGSVVLLLSDSSD